MKRYKALNEGEFHRMISEATMGVVMRVLQEATGLDELPMDDYEYPEDYYPEGDYDYPEEYSPEENYDYPDYLGESYYPRYY